MKISHTLIQGAALLLLSTLIYQPSAYAQGAAFTYQGQLNDGASPATGIYDLRFTIYDAAGGGTQQGNLVTNSATGVTNGLFTVTLDFGNQFPGADRWLEIAVRTNGAASFFTLSPRQALTPVPYAITAGNVTGLIPGGSLAGSYPGAVTLNNGANVFAGNGAGLTSLSASQLTSGTVPAAALGNAWQTGGNSGTSPGTNFLGTTDNQPLELRVSQARAFRLEPGTNTFSAVGAPNVIGGAPNNFVDGGVVGATIAGGGAVNMTGFMPGPSSNHVSAIFGTIGGGRLNTVAADHGFIGGGIANTIQPVAYDGVVGGGVANTIQSNASESVIAGGIQNTNGGYSSSIGGGGYNVVEASAWYSFIGGGAQNIVRSNSLAAFIGGGLNNSLQSSSNNPGSSWGAAIVGGENNTIAPNGLSTPRDSVIAGGSYNSLVGAYNSAIGGGTGNSLQSSEYSLIAGGYYNSIQPNVFGSAIGGGQYNQIQSGGYNAVIAGGYLNTVVGQQAVIGGGSQNANNGLYSSIGGGFSNLVQSASWYATVAGGQQNNSSAYYATIAGGIQNQAAGGSSAIGGGWDNLANNSYAAVSGGFFNTSSGFASVIGGGFGNVSQGGYASVPGGYDNTAAGDFSLAAGYLAQANHNGTFVWADTSSNSFFASTTTNQFNVRATGGIRLVTGGAGLTLDGQSVTTASALNNLNAANLTSGTLADARLSANVALLNASLNTFAGDLSMSGGAAYHHLQLSGGNANGYLYGSYPHWGDGVHLGYNYYADAVGGSHFSNPGGGTSRISVSYGSIVLATGDVGVQPNFQNLVVNGVGGTTVTVNGTFNNNSDRNAKQDFSPVSASQILDKVTHLPVSEWSYKADPATRHVGPVAQDFYSTFNVGTDDKHIAPIDEGGVALAAIQGLNEKVESEKQKAETQIEGLKAENSELKARLEKLEQIILNEKSNRKGPNENIQIPTSKIQRNLKHQPPNQNHAGSPGNRTPLELEVSSFSECWSLVLGAFSSDIGICLNLQY